MLSAIVPLLLLLADRSVWHGSGERSGPIRRIMSVVGGIANACHDVAMRSGRVVLVASAVSAGAAIAAGFEGSPSPGQAGFLVLAVVTSALLAVTNSRVVQKNSQRTLRIGFPQRTFRRPSERARGQLFRLSLR